MASDAGAPVEVRRIQVVQPSVPPPKPPAINQELYWGAFVGLVLAITTVAAMIVVRGLKKRHWEAPAIAVGTALACIVMMFWARPWHPPTDQVRQAVFIACPVAWTAVILIGWILIQRDRRKNEETTKNRLGEAKAEIQANERRVLDVRSDFVAADASLTTRIEALQFNLAEEATRIDVIEKAYSDMDERIAKIIALESRVTSLQDGILVSVHGVDIVGKSEGAG